MVAGHYAAALGLFRQCSLHNELVSGKKQLVAVGQGFLNCGSLRVSQQQNLVFVVLDLLANSLSVKQRALFRRYDNKNGIARFNRRVEIHSEELILAVIQSTSALL